MDVEGQRREGAFTLGQGVACSDQLQTVDQLIAGLVGAAGRDPFRPPVAVAATPSVPPSADPTRPAPIAVVGLGAILPDAVGIEAFWRNLVEGHDAVGPMDPGRWGHGNYFDPESHGDGDTRTPARHAALVRGWRFDPLPFRIPPRVLPTIDPSQRMALAASAEAIRRAGWDVPGRVDRSRGAVVIGNAMGGEFVRGMSLRVRFREVLAAIARDDLARGWTVADLEGLADRVDARLAEDLPPVAVDSMAGLLSNVVAGRVAAWLDWMGGNLTVDAACAASLAAVAVAVDWLRSGRCDAVLAGGVDTDMTAETFVGFSRTQALSSTGSSPFSRHADGFVMGEGAAMLALKRLDDALAAGDPIWGVLRGVGQSSDGRGRGITAPRAEGQRLALQRACAEAGVRPADLAMIEAHGTGTPLGDRTEVGVLADALRACTDGDLPEIWLGSVKSMIGHLKGAAGAAGLTKAVLALATGVIPPTLHAGPLHPDLDLADGALVLPRAPVALPGDRRRAGVSAFGFGGTNLHVILEAPPASAPPPTEVEALQALARPLVEPASVARWRPEDRSPLLLAYGAATPADLIARLTADAPGPFAEVAEHPHRITIVTHPPGRTDAVARAAAWLSDPQPPAPPGVCAGSGPPVDPIWLFPGQGSQRPGAVDSVRRFPAGSRAVAAVEAEVLRDDPRPLRHRDGTDPVDLHATLFAVAVGWIEVLRDAGVPVAGTLGHSLGAYAALVAARRWSWAEALPAVVARGRALAACPVGGMLAVRLPLAEARDLAAAHGLVVAAHNAARMTVVAGPTACIDAAMDALGPDRAWRVPVERAYHSPAVAPAAEAVARALGPGPSSPQGSPSGALAHRPSPRRKPIHRRRPDRRPSPRRSASTRPCPPTSSPPATRLWIEAGPGTTTARIAEPGSAGADRHPPRSQARRSRPRHGHSRRRPPRRRPPRPRGERLPGTRRPASPSPLPLPPQSDPTPTDTSPTTRPDPTPTSKPAPSPPPSPPRRSPPHQPPPRPPPPRPPLASSISESPALADPGLSPPPTAQRPQLP